MSDQARKPKSWILTVIISGAALAYTFLVFLPTQKSIASLRSELTRQRSEVLELGTLETEIVELQNRIDAVRATVDTWKERAPNEQQTATFIGVVSQLAQRAGARVERITPRSVVELASLQQHPADLTVYGDFVQIADFLKSLEQRPETIWLTRLNLTASGEDGASVKCELSFTVFTDNSDNSD